MRAVLLVRQPEQETGLVEDVTTRDTAQGVGGKQEYLADRTLHPHFGAWIHTLYLSKDLQLSMMNPTSQITNYKESYFRLSMP